MCADDENTVVFNALQVAYADVLDSIVFRLFGAYYVKVVIVKHHSIVIHSLSGINVFERSATSKRVCADFDDISAEVDGFELGVILKYAAFGLDISDVRNRINNAVFSVSRWQYDGFHTLCGSETARYSCGLCSVIDHFVSEERRVCFEHYGIGYGLSKFVCGIRAVVRNFESVQTERCSIDFGRLDAVDFNNLEALKRAERFLRDRTVLPDHIDVEVSEIIEGLTVDGNCHRIDLLYCDISRPLNVVVHTEYVRTDTMEVDREFCFTRLFVNGAEAFDTLDGNTVDIARNVSVHKRYVYTAIGRVERGQKLSIDVTLEALEPESVVLRLAVGVDNRAVLRIFSNLGLVETARFA